ncbi:YCF48-related protein [Fulvivirga ulvae]|uniref:WD40/YVTN/BNR-like repeat-containing protein n=1 Tax=Fulvivirga ulvae TaxID=2904245 RepID=UPI001F3E38E7|nr:YCF48-related protein [Fulvivirga ulvae]UII32114.1 YCF48-related protein [Fulvivirga ulvae]
MTLRKHLFFALILCLCFTACSSDDDGVKPADGQVDQGDGDNNDDDDDNNDNAAELTFTKLTTGTDLSFFSIHFIDEQNGFLAGGAASVSAEKALVLKSEDGGTTWTEAYSDTGFYITDVTALTDNILFATTSDGAILKSENAGGVWEKIDIESGIYLTGIRFLDTETGFLVGSTSGGNGKLFTTSDGGESWESIINTTPLENNALHEIAFLDNNTILASGGAWDKGVVLKSTNKGVDWTSINVADGVKILDISMIGNSGFALGDNGQFNAATEKGVLFKTTDGGETWENVDTGYDNRLRKIAIRGDIGIVAGYNKSNNLSDPEFVMMSFDGGEKWSRINHDFGLNSWGDVQFISDNKIILAGHKGLVVMIEVGE